MIAVRRGLPVLTVLWALAAFAGCGDKETDPGHHEQSPFLPRTSASNVLHNLRQAYLDRNVAQYDSLLADDFTFVLSVEDQQKPDMPDNWTRDIEVAIHRHMFDPAMAQTLILAFDPADPVWDSADNMYAALISNVSLYLYGSTPAHPTDVKEYRVTGGRGKFWFRKNGWLAPGTADSVWTVVKWQDNPIGSRGTVESQTWGSIKALYE
jgi:hypothetical protein